MLPSLVPFARPVSGEAAPIPGRYDPKRGLRVFDSHDGVIPVIDCPEHLWTVTKTDNQRERDDDEYGPHVPSTAVVGEHGTVPSAENTSFTTLLVLITKTLTQREADDDP
jgi:hypothetical protein